MTEDFIVRRWFGVSTSINQSLNLFYPRIYSVALKYYYL